MLGAAPSSPLRANMYAMSASGLAYGPAAASAATAPSLVSPRFTDPGSTSVMAPIPRRPSSSTGRHAARYGSTACTPSAANIGSSLWLCTIEAPASIPARATAAISAGVRGTWRLRLRGVSPFTASSTITGSAIDR